MMQTSGSILFVARDPERPSFRYRIAPAIEVLRQRGMRCRVELFPQTRYGRRLWDLRASLREASAVVIVKIQVAPPEAWWLRRLAGHLALDIDDAIYVRKPRGPLADPDDSWWRRAKFRATCRSMDLIIAGNRHLAEAVKPYGARVEIVPTPIDCERYQQSAPDPARPPRMLWIGQPENLIYLEVLKPVIARLQACWPELKLRVVCSRFPDWDESMLERVTWSSESEVRALASADVGVMPLSDNEWTRGKCAFKLLQYMAAGLPCVAAPVGANREVVTHDYNGFLATTEADWYESLRRLFASPELRATFGMRGLARVRSDYNIPGAASRTAELIAGLASSGVVSLPADAGSVS